MRIRTRLMVVIFLTTLQVLLVIGSLAWVQLRLGKSLGAMRSALDLNWGVADISILAGEYSVDNALRVRAQWESSLRSQMLRIGEHGRLYDAPSALKLREKLEQADRIALRLFEFSDQGRDSQVRLLHRALLLHFTTTVQEAGRLAHRLVESSTERLERDQKRGVALLLGLVVSVGVFVVVWLFFVRRSLIRLNEMTVHRDELARELDRREAAEAALRDAQRRMLTVVEGERARIGQGLHDGVAQELIAVRLLLEAQPESGPKSALRDRLCRYLSRASEDVRRVVNDLRPAALDDIGLNAALLSLARQYEDVGLEVGMFLPEDDAAIPSELRAQVYRIVQEALGNVRRHAEAERVTVQLALGEELMLTVEDDGRGFDSRKETSGNGLVNIRSRARTWGGEAEIESRPGSGTFVSVVFPLDPEKRVEPGGRGARDIGEE